MSEKIYALLLRLYPARFRKEHGNEALQLLRDRLRDEQGLWLRWRLACDLAADYFGGLVQSWSIAGEAPLVAATTSRDLPDIPTFRILERQPLRPGLLLIAGGVSAVVLAAFSFVLQYGRPYPSSESSESQDSPIERVIAQANREINPANSDESAGGEKSNSQGALSPGNSSERPRRTLSAADERRSIQINANEASVASSSPIRVAPPAPGAIQRKMLESPENGLDSGSQTFARDTRTTAPHGATVSAIQAPNFVAPATQSADCAIEAEVLSHNIGYMRLDAFTNPAVCHIAMRAAMSRLNNTEALIVDLRRNRGGSPQMVAYLAAWLIPHPEDWPAAQNLGSEKAPSLIPVAESRLANKPVYVLTSQVTRCAAEQFCYNLSNLHRVTLVGETTAGVPPVGASRPYDGVCLEGRGGVRPDVLTSAADAMQRARELAWSAVRGHPRTSRQPN